MRCTTAVQVLILSASLLLVSCGEFAGLNADRSPETGELNKMKLFLNDDELGVLYDSVVVDRPAVCSYDVDGYSDRGEIQIRGLSSRMDPKKSFTLRGNKDPDVKDALDAGGDPWLEYALAMKAYALAGLPVMDFRPVALYLNDGYLGYYNIVRLYNDSLNDHYGDRDGELFKITIFSGFVDKIEEVPIHGDSEKKFPDNDDFTLLDRYFSAAANLNDEDWIRWSDENVDMREVARYMAVRDFFGLADTVRVNFYVYFHHGKAMILPWDSDRGYNYEEPGGNNLITKRMMDNPAFREIYRDQMNTLFLKAGPGNILDDLGLYLDGLEELLRPSVNSEPAYFLKLEDFNKEVSDIRAFLSARPGDILGRPEWKSFFGS